MDDTVISIENLGKSYEISHKEPNLSNASYRRVNEELGRILLGPIRKLLGKGGTPGFSKETFWALREVSLDIKRGERLGLIGRNGAGKSTFLKLLSRIVMPTEGCFEIDGRVASLLEVGTGFHPELTGRENIFLNGSIFGLKRYQIQERYDEIVEFSGVEKFLDTPVKRYSSGMKVRLAFAVAAHLEPDILIVDEVLAVGDARFQKKCLSKMNEVAQDSNRTIIFVSHTMGFVEALCNRVIILEKGRVKEDSSDVQRAIHDYLAMMIDQSNTSPVWVNQGNLKENEFFRLNRMQLADQSGIVRIDQPIVVEFEIDLHKPDSRLMIGMSLFNDENQLLAMSYNTDVDPEMPAAMEPGIHTLRCEIPPNFLNERAYRIEFAARLNQGSILTERANCPALIRFEVSGGLSKSPYWTKARPGLTAPILPWTLA